MISIQTENWKIDNIQGVVFDKDGTIIDSHIYWGRIIQRRASAIIEKYSMSKECFDELCRVMGYCITEKKLLPEGPIALLSREKVINVVHQYLKSVCVNSQEKTIKDIFDNQHTIFMDELKDYTEILPEVKNFIKRLKDKGIKTSIVTSDSINNTMIILDNLGINNLFDFVIGKESAKEDKMTGIPALKAINKLDIQSENIVCIGDAPVDIIMAHKSNCKAGIGVSTGQILKAELSKYTKYIVSSFKELEIC